MPNGTSCGVDDETCGLRSGIPPCCRAWFPVWVAYVHWAWTTGGRAWNLRTCSLLASGLWVVQDVESSDISDSKDNWTTAEKLEKVAAVVEQFPSLYGQYTVPELAERADKLLGPTWANRAPSKPIVNTTDELEQLRAACDYLANVLTRIRFAGLHKRGYQGPPDSDLWRPISQNLWTEAKRMAGIPVHIRTKDIERIEQMRSLHAALESLAEFAGVTT